MFEISIAKKTGIAVVDTFITNLSAIAKDSNSNAFKMAFLFYSASKKNSAMNTAVTAIHNADGECYKDFVSWACDAYGFKKSAVYSYAKVGENVAYDENTDTYFYTALRDSMRKVKRDENDNIVEITYPSFSFDIPTFSPSACEILATADYNKVVQWIKDGDIRVEMSVRELKAKVKSLKKGETVENSAHTENAETDSTETENTETENTENKPETAEEKAEKLAFITKAMKWAVKNTTNTKIFFTAMNDGDINMLSAIFEKTAEIITNAVKKESAENA